MSAVQTTERYWAMARFPIGHKVVDSERRYYVVAVFPTREAAEYAAECMNRAQTELAAHLLGRCLAAAVKS